MQNWDSIVKIYHTVQYRGSTMVLYIEAVQYIVLHVHRDHKGYYIAPKYHPKTSFLYYLLCTIWAVLVT